MNFNKPGFTLAEVLITMTILGIVAAAALPNMVNNSKYNQLSAKLAKFSTTLNDATSTYTAAHGDFKDNSNIISCFATMFKYQKSPEISLNQNSVSTDPLQSPNEITGSKGATLKDGTIIKLSSNPSEEQINKGNINTALFGNPLFAVQFDPKIKGINRSYIWVVTNKGAAFPADDCTKAIISNQFVINNSIISICN